MKIARIAAAIAGLVASALVIASPAAADQPFLFGPIDVHEEYSFWNCGFEADVSLDGTFANRIFENPVRNINYIREEGTVTNPLTGATLRVKHWYTEEGRPPTSPDEGWGLFTDRGVVTHVVVPGGGLVLIDAGRLVWRYPDGLIFEANGNHQLKIEGDISELCAALAG
jgi:hypothetical protein